MVNMKIVVAEFLKRFKHNVSDGYELVMYMAIPHRPMKPILFDIEVLKYWKKIYFVSVLMC